MRWFEGSAPMTRTVSRSRDSPRPVVLCLQRVETERNKKEHEETTQQTRSQNSVA